MLKDTVAKIEREKGQAENVKWIHENLDDILTNYPARWCIVDGGIVRLAVVEFFDLFKTVSLIKLLLYQLLCLGKKQMRFLVRFSY